MARSTPISFHRLPHRTVACVTIATCVRPDASGCERQFFLPLPLGEGWDEGRSYAQSSPHPSSASGRGNLHPLPPWSIPTSSRIKLRAEAFVYHDQSI